jgi:hypothetical protein
MVNRKMPLPKEFVGFLSEAGEFRCRHHASDDNLSREALKKAYFEPPFVDAFYCL